MKKHFGLIVAASVVAIVVFTIGFDSYLKHTTAVAMVPYPNVSQSFKTTYDDGSSVVFAVKKPLNSTEYVELVYTGKGQAPANFEAKIDKEAALYAAITTQNDVRSLLNYIHLSLNAVGIEGGHVHDVLTSQGFEKEVDRNNYWQGFINKRWMKAPVYERLAEVVDSPEIRKDIRNVAALANIVQAKKDPQAVVYMHQIIHDLDKWVYENMHIGEEVSHFYVTNAEAGDKIYKIEEYVKRNVVILKK